ncbi:MAG TPA: ribonuclease III [Azospirillaceae bacterium]|nr:ribonuclease III [Azospirillaceae bacterium]
MTSSDVSGPGGQRNAAALEDALGHVFADKDLLRQALTHPSFAGTAAAARGEGVAYERLEFLGDRVLGLVVAEWLLERYPDEREGDLAKRHAGLVQRDALGRVAREIGLGAYLRLSPGEEEIGGRTNATLLADAMEAVIGAIYKDAGLAPARAFIRRCWAGMVEQGLAPPQDPKTRLQEWAQGRGRPLPIYEMVGRTGAAHDPVFEVRVTVRGLEPASGSGRTKRAAEKAAAQALLDRIGTDGNG